MSLSQTPYIVHLPFVTCDNTSGFSALLPSADPFAKGTQPPATRTTPRSYMGAAIGVILCFATAHISIAETSWQTYMSTMERPEIERHCGQGDAHACYALAQLWKMDADQRRTIYSGPEMPLTYAVSEQKKALWMAAELGLSAAQFDYAQLFCFDPEVVSQMSGDDLAIYKLKIGGINERIKWYRKSAQQGDADAMFWLSQSFSRVGDTTNSNFWLQKAADAGNTTAKFELARMAAPDPVSSSPTVRALAEEELLITTGNVPTQPWRSQRRITLQDIRAEAENGNMYAQYWMADIVGEPYLDADLNLQESALWCEKAARSGHPWAQHRLAWHYFKGEGGLPVDQVKAAMWAIVIKKNGHPSLQDGADWIISSLNESVVFTSEKRSEAKRLAQEFMETHPCPLPNRSQGGRGVGRDRRDGRTRLA